MAILGVSSPDYLARSAVEFIASRRVVTSIDISPFLGLSCRDSIPFISSFSSSLPPSKVDAVLFSGKDRFGDSISYFKFGRFFSFRLLQEVRSDIESLLNLHAPTFTDFYSRTFNYRRGPVPISTSLPKDLSSFSSFSYDPLYPELSLSDAETMYAKAELIALLYPSYAPFSEILYNLSVWVEEERQTLYSDFSLPSSHSEVLDLLSLHEEKLSGSSTLNNEVKASMVLESRLRATRALGLPISSVLPSILDHIHTLYGVDYKPYSSLLSY